MSKISVARALTASIASRVIRFATIIAIVTFLLILAGVWALAHFVSGWWWIMILPFIFLLSLFLVVRLFIVLIIRRIHSEQMTKSQRAALNEFTDKVQSLLEARSTPLPIIVLICIKDIVLHRDVTTIKKIIQDSSSLKSDYEKLEKLF